MRILAAEDDAPSRRLLEATLTRWGYEVITASDGQQAWDILQREDSPQLAVLDWMMPKMDGVDVCRQVRDSPQPRLIYIILLTTKDLREDIVAGLRAGADDYITKPFDREELRARVQVGARMVDIQARLAEGARQLEAEQQRARHLQEIMVERERFDAAVAAASDGILMMDEHNAVTSANRSACRLLNLPADSWHGVSLSAALKPFHLSSPLEKLLQPGRRTVSLEISRPDTRPPLYLDARLTRIQSPSGVLEGVLMTVRDITMERHVQSARADFFTMVSHKLRTPLSILGGYLAVCSQIPPERLGQISRILEVCDKETRHLMDLVERLLEFKSMSTQEMEKEAQQTDVEPVISKAVATVRERYPLRKASISVNFPSKPVMADVSATHLSFILDKLLDNAVKFGDKDPTEVTVTVESDFSDKLRFFVTDNGPGIPHEYFDRVFEGFVQVENLVTGQVPGLGVGLLMTRQILEAYGHTITVTSRLGDGSTFCFTMTKSQAAGDQDTLHDPT